jgi:hypothetical protein
MGLVFIILNFIKPEIKSTKDLYYIYGHILSHRFIDLSGGRRDYRFKLKEYSSAFQIKADFLKNFYTDEGKSFQQEEFAKLKKGENLTVAISKSDSIAFNIEEGKFCVYYIESNGQIFLNTDFTINMANLMGLSIKRI